ncbi:exopolysaccharide biosynthesis polyprenyl glycosylphosphotransferase [Aporhodopirellula aestuarii]|uniref:Exopolysaccharide biosynthesis polyprenyl glycosylphosphotransferase n=1 Tax=Aporhodopirellula aestuarii TaxID=2950107 RepID=A0ABT0TXM4_9BACT|nr:exopolysaccharide biosynthesis polyprenyl glycosylphosphotransferase [Aporhodopirellula aestuarii]MCM2369221.1 exopolysaccharide biosynthesis polyprenyl glycosylphosphotransferase [Aporhodopirellula aestuarii]
MSSLIYEAGIDSRVTSSSLNWPNASSVPRSNPEHQSKISTASALRLGRRQFWLDTRFAIPLIIADAAAAGASAITASSIGVLVGEVIEAGFIPVAILITLLAQLFHGLYPACGMSHSTEFRRHLQTALYVSVGMGLGMFFAGSFPWVCWLIFSIVFLFLLSSSRSLARYLLSSQAWWTQPILVVGNGERAARLFERLGKMGSDGLRPVGIVYDPHPHWTNNFEHNAALERDQVLLANAVRARVKRSAPMYIGPISELEDILLESGTCRIAIADCHDMSSNQFTSFHGIPHVAVPMDLSSQPTENVRIVEADGRVEMHCQTTLLSPQAMIAKRAMDLILVVGAMPFWIPVMVLIGLAIKLTDPGPIFYRQSRVGRFRQPFDALKFRSMCCDADRKLNEYLSNNPEMKAEWDATHKLQNDPRITGIGRIIRKTSLDELPQLINVLRGEMSLVGPRPIIDCSSYDREYIQEHPDVFEMYQMVRPGITGMWQVSGRNSTSYKQRIDFDRFYLHNWSIATDIFILWRTIKTALFQEGAC